MACSCFCLCCCGYRRLRAILVNLNCYFTLKALQKRFTVTPLLPFSLSPVVWFLCHFYAHYFAFAARLSLRSVPAFNLQSQQLQQKQWQCPILLLLLYFCELILISIRLLLFVVGLVFTVCSRLVAYLLHFVLWCLAVLQTIYGPHKHPANRVVGHTANGRAIKTIFTSR